ncbi:hypothetical protein [Tenacibaculum halocynthiae]|uniref:hypothetical protein n=1 Tax=Tenacibaculum halocynthiae TaxID=1254437 RepID=UPI003D6570C3
MTSKIKLNNIDFLNLVKDIDNASKLYPKNVIVGLIKNLEGIFIKEITFLNFQVDGHVKFENIDIEFIIHFKGVVFSDWIIFNQFYSNHHLGFYNCVSKGGGLNFKQGYFNSVSFRYTDFEKLLVSGTLCFFKNMEIDSKFRDGIFLKNGFYNKLSISSQGSKSIIIKGNKMDFINCLTINGVGGNTLIDHRRLNNLKLKGKVDSGSLVELKNIKTNRLSINQLENSGTVRFSDFEPANKNFIFKGFGNNKKVNLKLKETVKQQYVNFTTSEISPNSLAMDLYNSYTEELEVKESFLFKLEYYDSYFEVINSDVGHLEFRNSKLNNLNNIKINSKLSTIKTFDTVFPTKTISGEFTTLYEIFNDLYSVAISNNNKRDAVVYYRKSLNNLRKSVWKKKGNFFIKSNDWLSLGISNLYSAYGTSWLRSFFIATPIIAFIFFGGMLLTSNYDLAFSTDGFSDNIANFFKFLNPTHKLNFMDTDFYKYSNKTWFIIFDLFGRIFVGIGIFETIRSFRKYSRK